MIIPVRCFTCNKVLGDKWTYYKQRVKEMYQQQGGEDADDELTSTPGSRHGRGELLDEMGITRMCCRRHLLTHVDLIDIL